MAYTLAASTGYLIDCIDCISILDISTFGAIENTALGSGAKP